MKNSMRCGECGEKKLERVNVNGKFSAPYLDYPRAYLTTDLILPVCQNCGNHGIENNDAENIDHAMEESVRDQASQFLETIKARADVTGMRLAYILGVTPEYISIIQNKKKTPSFHFWNILRYFAKHPDRISTELDPLTDVRSENLLRRA